MAAPQILLIGGYGQTGRRLAGMLVQYGGVDVVLAGRSLETARAIAENINRDAGSSRVRCVRLDVRDIGAFRNTLEGFRLVVHAGPALGANVTQRLVEATIEAGADWIDVQIDEAQSAVLRELDSFARERDVCVAIQSGFHPGLPGAMVRWAVKRVEHLRVAEVFSFLNPEKGLILTQGMDELIELFRHYRVKLFQAGVWEEMSMWDRRALRSFDFSLGYGRTACAAMALDELDDLPKRIDGLEQTGFFIGGSDPVTNWIVSPLLFLGLKLLPFVSNRFWAKLWAGSLSRFSRPPYGTVLELAASGETGGQTKTFGLVISHDDEYVLTAAPVAATVAQLLDGPGRRPGVHYAAHLPEPERLLDDLEGLGLSVHRRAPSA